MYNYRGNEYKLKPLTLGLKSAIVDLLEERNKLTFEVLSKLDLKIEHEYELKRKRLQARIAQCEAGGKDPTQPKNELESLTDQMLTDTKYLALQDYKNQQLGLISIKILYNEDLMKKFAKNVLTPECELDFNDEQTEEFLKKVMDDFFLLTSRNSSE